MVIDTSALVTVLQDEPERRAFNEMIESAESCILSAASLVEVSIVIESRYGSDGIRTLDLYLSKAGVEIVEVDENQAMIARRAFKQYGKGRHPAGLNYGDCFSYALAKSRAEPLLFKGEDFSRTDLEQVSLD